jgi:hypothetical protein
VAGLSSYSEEPDFNRAYLKRHWLSFTIILGMIAFWVIMRGKMGSIKFDKATVWVGLGFMLMYCAFSSYAWLQNITPKLITAGMHTTTDGRWEQAGNFVLFTKGDIYAFGLSVKGKDGTVIIPSTAVNPFGDNVCGAVRTIEKKYDELPPEVRAIIDKKNMPGPYEIGYVDEDQLSIVLNDPTEVSGVKKPNVSYLIGTIENLNTFNKKLQDLIELAMTDTEKFLAAAKRITSVAGESIGEKLKEMFIEKD